MGQFDYENKHIVEADHFNQQAWDAISGDSNAVKELIEKGKIDVGDDFDGLVDDVFQSLYQYKPEVREKTPEHLNGNKLLVDQLYVSQEYNNLRVESYLDKDMSAIGTLMLADELREQVNKDAELKKTLDDLNGKGEEGGKSGKDGKPKKGKKPGKDGKPKKGKKPGKDGKPKKGKKPGKGKQEKQPTEEQVKIIRRAVEKAAKKAGDKLSEAATALSSYGLDEGELKKTPLDERKELIDRLLSNPKLKEIADRVGRLDRIITSQKLTRVKHGAEEIVDITLSNDLAHLTPRELVMMDEAPDDFNRRFANKELITYDLEGQEPTGKGPVVVLIDKSWSMNGDCDNWATAITFSLMMQAMKEKRDIYFAAFNAHIVYDKKFEAGKYTFSELMELCEIGCDGGTRFEPAIELALDACKSDPKLRTADIVFVTDGDARIEQHWLDEVNAQKKRQDVNIFTILIGCDSEIHALKEISNEVYDIEKIIKDDETFIGEQKFMGAATALVHSTEV